MNPEAAKRAKARWIRASLEGQTRPTRFTDPLLADPTIPMEFVRSGGGGVWGGGGQGGRDCTRASNSRRVRLSRDFAVSILRASKTADGSLVVTETDIPRFYSRAGLRSSRDHHVPSKILKVSLHVRVLHSGICAHFS